METLHYRIKARDIQGKQFIRTDGYKAEDMSFTYEEQTADKVMSRCRQMFLNFQALTNSPCITIEVSFRNSVSDRYPCLYSFYGSENRFVNHSSEKSFPVPVGFKISEETGSIYKLQGNGDNRIVLVSPMSATGILTEEDFNIENDEWYEADNRAFAEGEEREFTNLIKELFGLSEEETKSIYPINCFNLD